MKVGQGNGGQSASIRQQRNKARTVVQFGRGRPDNSSKVCEAEQVDRLEREKAGRPLGKPATPFGTR